MTAPGVRDSSLLFTPADRVYAELAPQVDELKARALKAYQRFEDYYVSQGSTRAVTAARAAAEAIYEFGDALGLLATRMERANRHGEQVEDSGAWG